MVVPMQEAPLVQVPELEQRMRMSAVLPAVPQLPLRSPPRVQEPRGPRVSILRVPAGEGHRLTC